MEVAELVRMKRAESLRIAARHGARNVRMSGSAARSETREGSDLDLVVDGGPETSPWFPAGLILDLEELLGLKVDVVTEESIYWLLRRRILKEAVPL